MAKIIFLEGSDYVGKSVQLFSIANYIASKGKSLFFTTRSPGGSFLGLSIRNLLLDKDFNEKSKTCYLSRRLLYAADHAQLIEEINSKLNDKNVHYDYILIDRYNPCSDLAYGALMEDDPANITKKLKLSESIYDSFDNSVFLNNETHLVLMTMPESILEERSNKVQSSRERELDVNDMKDLAFKKRILENYNKLVTIYKYNSVSGRKGMYRRLNRVICPSNNFHHIFDDGSFSREQMTEKILEVCNIKE